MDRISAVAALDQPVRRELYRLLTDAEGWTSRDDAAAVLGIPRSVAAFHLDKLAAAGVVEVRYERTSGRTGPGAGRPSKLYRPAAEEVAASVPDRRYDLAGSLLVDAVAESAATGAPVAECVRSTALATGRRMGSVVSSRDGVLEVLAGCGYEPTGGRRREVVLDNCPFHRLAEDHRELVCGMNLHFLTGVLEGAGVDDRLAARLAPEPGRCCVRIGPAA